MAETLGSLCDKLTIVKLKQFHTRQKSRQDVLVLQEQLLVKEVDDFVQAAIVGQISVDELTFSSNKIYKRQGNDITQISGTIGVIVAKLAEVNCALWHEQEKVYDFERVPEKEKNKVVKQLAVLNLERNQCIDRIDKQFQTLVEKRFVAR
jgi:hypothetical protein